MSNKILIVDDIEFNIKLLTAKLQQKYYQIYTAKNGKEAIAQIPLVKPDLILMDVMMPEMDGYTATKIIKEDPASHHLPIIMVTALNSREEKLRGLESGADDFLSKPVNDFALFARIASLLKLKRLTDEIQLHAKQFYEAGIYSAAQILQEADLHVQGSNILIIDTANNSARYQILKQYGCFVDFCITINEVKSLLFDKAYGLVLINTNLLDNNALSVVAMLKAEPTLKMVPVLAVIYDNNPEILQYAFEVGITDYIDDGFDSLELWARVRAQIRRTNYQQIVQKNILQSINNAIYDSLTNVFNRRYLELQAPIIIQDPNATNSLLMLDIDNFKAFNDQHGHLLGDKIIQHVVDVIRSNIRHDDLLFRYGGDEFILLFPGVPMTKVSKIGERLLEAIKLHPLHYNGEEFPITFSIGVTTNAGDYNLEQLIRDADQKLYQAKSLGKNKMVA